MSNRATRSDRAKRRAAKIRNQRIMFGAAIVLVLGAIAFLVYTALTSPDEPAVQPTTAAGQPTAVSSVPAVPTPTPGGPAVTELQTEELVAGTGEEAQTGDTVRVHYTGWLTDGTQFDSSRTSGETFSFTIGAGNVIQGWDQGVTGMRVGGTRRLVIPPELGYGANGYGPIPGNATLVFDVELMEVVP